MQQPLSLNVAALNAGCRVKGSVTIYLADDPAQQAAAQARQIRYYRQCAIAAFLGNPRTASLSCRYFIGMVEQVRQVHLQDLTGNAVLLGRPAQIITSARQLRAPAALAEEAFMRPHPRALPLAILPPLSLKRPAEPFFKDH